MLYAIQPQKYDIIPTSATVLADFFPSRIALLPHLSVALDDPLVGSKLFQPHRTAGMELLGTDAYLGTQTKLSPIGK